MIKCRLWTDMRLQRWCTGTIYERTFETDKHANETCTLWCSSGSTHNGSYKGKGHHAGNCTGKHSDPINRGKCPHKVTTYTMTCTKSTDKVYTCGKTYDCNKTTSTVESYKLTCSRTIDGYYINCGMYDGQLICNKR